MTLTNRNLTLWAILNFCGIPVPFCIAELDGMSLWVIVPATVVSFLLVSLSWTTWVVIMLLLFTED